MARPVPINITPVAVVVLTVAAADTVVADGMAAVQLAEPLLPIIPADVAVRLLPRLQN